MAKAAKTSNKAVKTAKPKGGKLQLNTKFKIENIVASADLGVELDLYGIAKDSPDVDYEPEQFPGAICKIHDPKTAILLFKNGKIICTGGKTESDIKKAIEQVIKIVKTNILEPQPGSERALKHKGKKIEINPKFKIENIVASAALGVELDLYGIAKDSPDVDYEPEQFPGAICKIHDPKTAILLFKNGKIICTGGKTESDIKKAIEQVTKIIKTHILPPRV